MQTHRQSFHTTLANASTISPTLRLRFGSRLSCYKSQARGVTMATSSKIPLPPMEERKGRFFAPLALFCWFPSLRCQWSGTPDAERDTFSDAPRDHQGPRTTLSSLSFSVPPQPTAFLQPTLPRGFPFPLAFNDTTLINSVNGSSTL